MMKQMDTYGKQNETCGTYGIKMKYMETYGTSNGKNDGTTIEQWCLKQETYGNILGLACFFFLADSDKLTHSSLDL